MEMAKADCLSAQVRVRAEWHPLEVVAHGLQSIGLVVAVVGVSLMLVGGFSHNTSTFVGGVVTTLVAAVLGHRAATLARCAAEAPTPHPRGQ
jgi:hypothetical protein